MSLFLQMQIFAQLLLTTILSMIIGLDRERREKSAGIRTHILTGIGACLFTAVGLHAFPDSDTSRIAASVVSGISFLGAGVIFYDDDRVHALTTAASIWATASIGVTVGAGLWLLAISATVLVWLILAIMHNLGIRHHEKNEIGQES